MLLSSIKMLFDSITQAKWESPLTASVHLGGFAKPKQHQGLRFPLTQEEGIAATAAGGFQSRRLDNGVTDNFLLKISATQPHAVAFRPCALSELTLSIPVGTRAGEFLSASK